MTAHDLLVPRILFAEQFYYPEGWGGAQLPRDITIHLARSGWQVEVICGSDTYAPVDDQNVEDPASAGVTIRRIPRLFGGDIHRRKLLRQLWFYVAAIPLLLVGRRTLYVTQTNPPLIVPIAALVAAIRRRPLIIIAQDIYPEVMVAHGMVNERSLPARMLANVFRWAYRRAERVVSLGPVMSQRLLRKGVAPVRIVQISNWATGTESVVRGNDNQLRNEWGLRGKFVMMYSGNVGVAHDVETPLRALARVLPEMPNLVLVIIGKGTRLQEARTLASELGVEHAVQFRALVPLEMLPHSLGLADLALVTLRPGFEGLVVPSKLFGYMARGIPSAYVGPPSDISAVIESARGGLTFLNGDQEGMARALGELAKSPDSLSAMGAAASEHYHQHLSRAVGLRKYRELLERVLPRSRSREPG